MKRSQRHKGCKLSGTIWFNAIVTKVIWGQQPSWGRDAFLASPHNLLILSLPVIKDSAVIPTDGLTNRRAGTVRKKHLVNVADMEPNSRNFSASKSRKWKFIYLSAVLLCFLHRLLSVFARVFEYLLQMYPQNWKNQSEIHVVLSLFAAVYGSVDCLLKSLCLTNLGNCQREFCLSPESAHCYALYSCLCLVNAFEIIPIQVQDWTRGEDIVQTYNKWWIKHLKIPKTVFSPLQHVIPCAFYFIFSKDFVPISLQIEGYKCFYVFLPRKIFGN